MPGNILYIGSPLLDLSIMCDFSILNKFNLKLDDCIQSTDPAIFEEIFRNPTLTVTPGGSAQNSARVSKWLLQDRGHVSFTGCVGRDAYAEKMEQELHDVGVEPLYCYHDFLPTGICGCLVAEKGKRSMCTRLGAAATFSSDFLSSGVIQEQMKNADIIYIVGHFVSHSHESVMTAAKYCDDNNKVFAINLSAPYICKSHKTELLECLPYADVVFGNQEEALAFVQDLGSSSDDVGQCAEFIASIPKSKKKTKPRVCIISQGADSVLVAEGNGKFKVFEVPRVEDIVDTIGCGDALVGGILAQLSCCGGLDSAIKIGISAAGKIAQTSGCTLPKDSINLFSEIGNNLL